MSQFLSTPPEISIRRAVPADADFAASMIQLSMGSLADHLFDLDRSLIPGVLEALFLENAGRFGRGMAFVAEADGRTLGILMACRGACLKWLNLGTIPPAVKVMGVRRALGFFRRVIQLPGGREAEADEYYISNLGVDPTVQGRGIGTRLIAFAERNARLEHLTKCALVVGLYNQNALRLYERLGFRIVETVPDEHEALGYHRMVKVLG